MVGSQDVSMTKSFESKFDILMNTINALTTRLAEVEGCLAYNNSSSGTTSTRINQPFTSGPQEIILHVVRQDLVHAQQCKEPRVSLPKKFDGTQSNFRGIINQVQLITMLQPKRHPTKESKVGLVGTLLIGLALSWFAPLFEQRSPILSKFKTFLEAMT